jgi:tetratricopeptide (TPR) repeat protein
MLSGPTADDSDALRQKAQRLQQRLEEAPDDTEARRDLGAVYVRLGTPDSARWHLQRVHEQTPDDPKTMYFLGLAHERLGNADRALDLYGQYSDVATSSRYRKLMRGRHDWLRRAKAQETVRARAQGEADTTDLSPQTVAVFPLAYQGSDSTYAPLGRGLGELILTDLSNVGRLQVLERIRLQALFNELELAVVVPDKQRKLGLNARVACPAPLGKTRCLALQHVA